MRTMTAAILLLALPALAAAQSRSSRADAPRSSNSLPPIGMPLPPIAQPLPPIGLPLPPIGLPPTNAGDHPDFRGETPHRPFRSRPPAVIYFPAYYGWGYSSAPPFETMDSRSAAPSSSGEYRSGVLRLDIEPASARVQLFVDGLFVGSPTDFDNEISLEAGSHAIELRADGYESIAFNARIVAAQAITYRGTLRALAKAESAAGSSDRAPNPAAATPKRSGPDTFYFIPGCYMGNVPPEQVVLPASCDKSKLVTRTR